MLPDPIPGKGEMLCQISNFWFDQTAHLMPNHLTGQAVAERAAGRCRCEAVHAAQRRREALKPVPVEAIARGYLIGSGWKDYQATGSLCGIAAAGGAAPGRTVAATDLHAVDEGRGGRARRKHRFRSGRRHDRRGSRRTSARRDAWKSILLPRHAAERGIIIADTKFEFGTDAAGKLYVMDEMLTPDSSRFWPADQYRVGISPPSYDKQFVRDYLETLDWNKTAPGPKLPRAVIDGTAAKYAEALKRLAGIGLD